MYLTSKNIKINKKGWRTKRTNRYNGKEVNMKRVELKKIVKFEISDIASACELKGIRNLIKLFKTDIEHILDYICTMLEEEGLNHQFYIWEYVDADVTFYDRFSGLVTVKAYGYGDDGKMHVYVIYSTVNDDLSIEKSALVSIDGLSYSIGQ